MSRIFTISKACPHCGDMSSPPKCYCYLREEWKDRVYVNLVCIGMACVAGCLLGKVIALAFF